MRVLLLILGSLASACTTVSPTLRRLSPPRDTLGPVKTLHLSVVTAAQFAPEHGEGVVEQVEGEPEPISWWLRRAFTTELEGLGYALCAPAPCGDGELKLEVSRAHFAQNKGTLAVRQTFTNTQGFQPLSSMAMRLRSDDRKPAAVLMREEVARLAAELRRSLSRDEPMLTVQLEGGGALDRGVALLRLARWAEAATYFRELTRTQPELDGAWYDLGVALEGALQWAEASAAYQEAEQRAKKPHYTRAIAALAHLARRP